MTDTFDNDGRSPVVVHDGLRNVASSVGTGKAKVDNRKVIHCPLRQTDVEAFYTDDWLARKMVDIVPQDMIREWRTWEARQADTIYETEQRLRIRSRLRQALTWARLYGGSGILMGDAASNPEKEFVPETVVKDGLLYLHAFSRYEIEPDETTIQRDVLSADYGKPTLYIIRDPDSSREVRVHRSRFLIFDGVDIPRPLRRVNKGWGMPLFQAVHTAILNASSTTLNSAELTEEAKLDVIQIPNLSSYFTSPEAEGRLIARLTLANQMKSTVNTLILGGDEKFERKQTAFAGLSDLIRMHLEVAAAAADVPATRLLSTSPKGMNATGDSDTRNYNDMIRSKQTTELADAIRRLDTAIKRSAVGRDIRNATYTWNPLWQMPPDTKAAIERDNAERDKIYAAFFPGAAFARTIRDQLVATTTYNTLDRNVTDQELSSLTDDPLPTQAATAIAATRAPVDPGNDNGPVTGTEQAAVEAGTRPVRNAGAAPGRRGRAAPRDMALKDAMPKTLYVRRMVKNGRAIRRWAAEAGFPNIITAAGMHVTVAYSTKPIDWFDVSYGYGLPGDIVRLPAGGPRDVERFDNNTGVLLFKSMELTYRWSDFIDAGAEWAYEAYSPHISFAQPIPEDMDLTLIEPYQGPIVLGPELWSAIEGAPYAPSL
jgi:phage-related protein (TIGR01555 family)